MPSAGFEPATPATKRLQTYALDHAATGIGYYWYYVAYLFDQGITVIKIL
jgi:hypothetical protein